MGLYDQIFDFVFYSEGAFTFEEVRGFPISLRLHYLKRLEAVLKERASKMKQAANKRR